MTGKTRLDGVDRYWHQVVALEGGHVTAEPDPLLDAKSVTHRCVDPSGVVWVRQAEDKTWQVKQSHLPQPTPRPLGADHDHDGVPNEQDACPGEAGPQASVGCPRWAGWTAPASMPVAWTPAEDVPAPPARTSTACWSPPQRETWSLGGSRSPGSGGGRPLLVLDACFTGATRGGGELLAGTRFVVPGYARAAELQWNSASPGEIARPLDAAQHGAFTYFAVGATRGWADGELDGRRDGTVTALEANTYVARALRMYANGQSPQWLGDDVVLAVGVSEVGPSLDAAPR